MKQIPLQNGMFALVDDEDYERCMKYTWHVITKNNCGRLQVVNSEDHGALNRFILERTDNVLVSCVNKNGLDCQKENLKLRTPSSAIRNSRSHRFSSSKYKGVGYERGQWRADIYAEGKNRRIGRFENEDDAARAYNETAFRYWGEDCYQNIIGEDNQVTTLAELERVKYKRKRNKSSTYKGVSLQRRGGKNPWTVFVRNGGKAIYIGVYETEIEAAKAYDKKMFEFHGEHAKLNFPKERVN